MSNTGQIKRYKFSDSEVSFGIPQPIDSDNGEYVTYDNHLNIVNDLEMRIDDLKRSIDRIFKVVSSFNGGMTPVGCNNVITLKVDEYNALVSALNATE